jgi:hydroxyethylthiazole kinase
MSIASLKKAVAEAFDRIRRERPMIHQITNYVVMNQTANATIHVGASPVMAHAPEEVEQMVSVANALVINAGTLSEPWVRGMNLAGKRANEKGVPIVFDPVGVGATTYRTEAIIKMLNSLDIAILKGNSGEIGQINNEEVLVRGVDSLTGAVNPSDTVRQLAQKRNKTTVVALSGPTDYVSDGDRVVMVKNQCDRLNQLTGMGCTVAALMACFAGVTKNYLVAAVGGFAVMGVCAQLAATDENVRGAASFQVALFDRFSTLTGSELEKLMDIEIVDN